MVDKNPLSLFPVIMELPIRWGDMDAFNHVNNVTYFRYFECVRIAYFEALGIEGYANPEGVGPILGQATCKFKFPLTYPDTLKIGARTTELESNRYHQEYIVYSPRHQRIAAQGTGVIVNYDYDRMEKADIPDSIVQKIQALEDSAKAE